MIIDGAAYLGHWPFNKLIHNDAKAMLRLMDRAGIDKAVVSSINSLFYRDVMEGNRELAAEITPHNDRFIPFAVINPAYPGFERDFFTSIDELSMEGIEISPGYHNYNADCKELKRLLELAAQKKKPVRISARMTDIRGRHWLDAAENLSIKDIERIVSLCGETDFIICSANTAELAKLLEPKKASRTGKLFYDFSRLDNFSFHRTFQALLSAAGADSVVLGTAMPTQYPEPQLVKLHFSGLSEEDVNKIEGGNLQKLFA